MKQTDLLLIDGSSVLVRAYFATAYSGRLRQTSTGTYTNAVLGFLNMLFGGIEVFRPKRLFVAWDVSRDTFRRTLYPDYKGTRGELPAEMLEQFDTTQRVLDTIGVAQGQHDEYEADDLIGTMAQTASDAGLQSTVLTGDHDALQLVSPHVTVAIMKKGVTERVDYTPEKLFEVWGLGAHQIPDLKGLMGDTSDNIPGVPGVGEKTAKKLLAAYGSLEAIYEHIDEVKGKLGERLITHRELAFLSRQLATIVRHAPLDITLPLCRLQIDHLAARDIFDELQIGRLYDTLTRVTSAG